LDFPDAQFTTHGVDPACWIARDNEVHLLPERSDGKGNFTPALTNMGNDNCWVGLRHRWVTSRVCDLESCKKNGNENVVIDSFDDLASAPPWDCEGNGRLETLKQRGGHHG
jgi:hypothetical protein